MPVRPTTIGMAIVCLAGACFVAGYQSLPPAHAQSKSSGTKKSSKKSGNVKTLDVRAQRLQTEFIKDSTVLARDYESAGELEKARQVYSALSKLNPQSKDIRDRLNKIDEAILTKNAFEVDIDTSLGWGVPLARVTKGKPIQLQSSGTYRFQANVAVGTTGFSVKDPTKGDMAGNVRCGALMGMVVANGKPGKPFSVGGSSQFTPRNDGLLYLRVNVPAGSKCTGRLSVRLGGYVERN